MSYQVLARKWRPVNFQQLVGQEHVLQPLVNALTQQRLHHAYLFTGTRGVGKTTIARILARCLNCEAQITAEPCGQCAACQEINSGRFVDLIEVDAASRTRVEDTRELLDNVQYAPTRGRFKIYLIDEVHMLSNHSFNALLKTLEEPPPHVKFLLATTDPQRLPVTILSRCLQFHLKNLSPQVIAHHLQKIVAQENISAEPEALAEIGAAADGSVRDALSLLDQAIACCQAKLDLASVQAMLGTMPKDYIYALLEDLATSNAASLLNTIAKMAELNADFNAVLAELLAQLHQISILQLIPESLAANNKRLALLADKLHTSDVQLFYQIGLLGRRDLPFAPSSRVGFEMTLLRMLAFYPLAENSMQPSRLASTHSSGLATVPPNTSLENNARGQTQTLPRSKPQPVVSPASTAPLPDNAVNWVEIMPKLNISGMTFALASHCVVKSWNGETLELLLAPKHKPLLNDKMLQRLSAALENYYHKPIRLSIQLGENGQVSPAEQLHQQQQQLNEQTKQTLLQDEHVQTIISQFNAKLVSTQPLDKKR